MHYCGTKFTPDVIKQGLEVFKSVGGSAKACYYNVRFKNQEEWHHDSASEFFSDYVKEIEWGTIDSMSGSGYGFRVMYKEGCSWVTIEAPERSKIEDVHYIFSNSQENCKLPTKKQKDKVQPVVFIGHGRSSQWRDLKDHLQDKHKYIIEAYEVGARAGHTIRDILDEMMTKSSFALLVLTAEDRDENGAFHARENVIHGKNQGKNQGDVHAIMRFLVKTSQSSSSVMISPRSAARLTADWLIPIAAAKAVAVIPRFRVAR